MPTAVELKDAIIANIEADTGNTQVAAAQTVWLAASKAIVPHLGGGGGGISDGDKGDIVVSGSGSIWTLDTNVVSLAKLAQIATGRFLGRASGGTGNVEALTGTQATALLDTFTGGAKGLVPAPGAATGRVLHDDGTWSAVSGSGGGGYRGVHVPSALYAAGEVVRAGPYLWGADVTTNSTPMVVEGNLGGGSDWAVQTTGSSGMVQSGTELLLINGAASSSTTAYRQSTNSGFLGKMLIVDLQMSGAADWLHFGLMDSTASQAATNINTSGTTFYGVNINLFNARVENWIDGVASTNSPYTNANITNAGAAYSRWYLYMIQNGSNWNLRLYRDTRVAGSVLAGGSTNQADDIVAIAQFTNVARPSYSTWRFVVGARTGGAVGIFRCRGAWVYNADADWSMIGRLPTLV